MVVDARGLSCPLPVLKAKEALAKNNKFDIIVDNETAKGNVTRFATNNGCKVSITKDGDDYTLSIEK